MSYPADRYLGEGGELSAWVRGGETPPDLTYAGGTSVHYLATGATTNGQFGLYRWDMGPEPSGPPAHFHRSISESFYVLSGVVRVYDGSAWHELGPGEFAHCPEGGIHAFRNDSGEPASMLLHFSPGAPREDYFERLPSLAQMTGEEMTAFFQAHDTYWV